MLTKECADNLHLAIDRAKGYGKCTYTGGCVIAQLFLIEGFDDAYINTIEGHGVVSVLMQDYVEIRSKMARYGSDLLRQMQVFWDSKWIDGQRVDDEVTMREQMHRVVDENMTVTVL